MNRIISDTAEYGCYLFAHACTPMLKEFMEDIDTDVIGCGLPPTDNAVDNKTLVEVNAEIRYHLAVALHQLERNKEALTELKKAMDFNLNFEGYSDAIDLLKILEAGA